MMHPTSFIVQVVVATVAALAVAGIGVEAERRCRNPACTEAISIVRSLRDFRSEDGSFSFRRMSTFPIISKDDQFWEAKVCRFLMHVHVLIRSIT